MEAKFTIEVGALSRKEIRDFLETEAFVNKSRLTITFHEEKRLLDSTFHVSVIGDRSDIAEWVNSVQFE